MGFYTDKKKRKRPITPRVEGVSTKILGYGERSPYGESRNKALNAVERLRESGERSRLIETNRRLKLYAPYRSILGKDGSLQLTLKESDFPSPLISSPLDNVKRADISILLKHMSGHDIEVIPLPGGKYDVKILGKKDESREEFEQWKKSIESKLNESRSKRMNRHHESSQFQLHTTSNDERSYAESVKRELEGNNEFRNLNEERRKIVLGYVNVGLNEYFSMIEEEEGAIGKGAEWDYMDAREFPVSDIVKESLKPGSSGRKSTAIGELVNEWSGTEGGRAKF